ncbi:NADH-quinone oxidoreductase subunit NuoF [Acidobacteriia bacterium AH_259_A11_L15]|nr:NADH-quinone oxidoreductase subunit NuoF [Acidobacteriia bacterium AH_259_A11_L15]
MALQLSPQLRQRFQELKRRYPSRRSPLIPMLMFAQDEFGYISDDLIAFLAEDLNLRPVQVVETVAYYSMLRRRPAGKYHLQVCTNVSCLLRGAEPVLDHVRQRCAVPPKSPTPDGLFSYEEVECLGACTGAPCVQVNYDYYETLDVRKMDELMNRLRAGKKPTPVPYTTGVQTDNPHPAEVRVISRRFGLPDSTSIDTYLKHEGYQALEKALKQMKPEEIVAEVKRSNLRGRGGAGFPTGMKWGFVPKEANQPKYIIANADESEPGTCKDRPLMELDPHQLIEGMLIAARAVHAHQGYIYIRGEYRYVMEILDRALAEAYERGYLGKNILGSGFDFHLCTHTGAGAYECGEESALMESLEGKRGYPRIRPPFPAVVGLYGCPTVINNVETLSAVPSIILRGGDWYANLGTPRNGGTRLFCLSGHVNRPGIYELPMGFPLRRMIEEVAGGMRDGKKLKAVIPGGSSVPVLTADQLDTPMDFDSVARAGSMLGSGGVMVMDEDTCMVRVAQRIMHFYAHESCGWCIPCREGTAWLRKMLDRFHDGGGRQEDIPLLKELAQNMLGKTFCPLGDAAAMPTISLVEKFRDEFEEHLRTGECPLARSPAQAVP